MRWYGFWWIRDTPCGIGTGTCPGPLHPKWRTCQGFNMALGLSVTDAVRRIAGSIADNVSGVPNGPVRWLLPVIPKGHFKENLQFRPLACGSGHAFNRPLQVLQAWWLSSRKRPYRNLSHLAVREESRPETNLPGSSGMRGVIPCRGFSLHCIL